MLLFISTSISIRTRTRTSGLKWQFIYQTKIEREREREREREKKTHRSTSYYFLNKTRFSIYYESMATENNDYSSPPPSPPLPPPPTHHHQHPLPSLHIASAADCANGSEELLNPKGMEQTHRFVFQGSCVPHAHLLDRDVEIEGSVLNQGEHDMLMVSI